VRFELRNIDSGIAERATVRDGLGNSLQTSAPDLVARPADAWTRSADACSIPTVGDIPDVRAYLDDLETCLEHGGNFIDGALWCAARAGYYLITFPELRREHLARWRRLVDRMEELAPNAQQPATIRERFLPLFTAAPNLTG
jgi:hypothetical protein